MSRTVSPREAAANLEVVDVREVVYDETVRRVFDEMHMMLGNLRCRWEDERDYEDFADYEMAVRGRLADFPKATFVALKKRPFEMHYTVVGSDDVHVLRVTRCYAKLIHKVKR